MPQLSAEASDLSWLVANFAHRTPGVAHAMVVSADGLPVAVSDRLDRSKADQLAAIASGLAGLTQGGARCIEGGLVTQTLVEMDQGGCCWSWRSGTVRVWRCWLALPAMWGWSAMRWPCWSLAPATSSPPGCGPSSKPRCHHEHPRGRQGSSSASSPGGTPTGAVPAGVTGPPGEAPP